jgi:hypothetical protein
LSFCPHCEAVYRKLRYDSVLIDEFTENLLSADLSGDLKIALDEHKIHFTATHLAEIQELLRLQSEEEN